MKSKKIMFFIPLKIHVSTEIKRRSFQYKQIQSGILHTNIDSSRWNIKEYDT